MTAARPLGAAAADRRKSPEITGRQPFQRRRLIGYDPFTIS